MEDRAGLRTAISATGVATASSQENVRRRGGSAARPRPSRCRRGPGTPPRRTPGGTTIRGQHHLVGHELPLPDPGDPLGVITQPSQVLHVERGDHVDARPKQFLDVLPALVAAAAGHIAVRQLVDEDHGPPSGQHRVGVQLFQTAAPVPDAPPRNDLEALRELVQAGPAMSFDQAHDHVAPELGKPAALGEHRMSLPGYGNRSQIDMQPAGFHGAPFLAPNRTSPNLIHDPCPGRNEAVP
jgi:hypothetical protein